MVDKTHAPVDVLSLVTPFPSVHATTDAVQLSDLTAGKPAVLHMYTS